MVIEINDISAVRNGSVLLDFYTSTCGPCKLMQPALEEISREFSDLKVAKIEVTENPEASQMFGVTSVPTVMFLKDSKVQDVSYGFSSKDALRSMVSRHMSHA